MYDLGIGETGIDSAKPKNPIFFSASRLVPLLCLSMLSFSKLRGIPGEMRDGIDAVRESVNEPGSVLK